MTTIKKISSFNFNSSLTKNINKFSSSTAVSKPETEILLFEDSTENAKTANNFEDNFMNAIEKGECTFIVGFSSVINGIGKFAEGIGDGVVTLGVGLTSAILSVFGVEEIAKEIEESGMNFVGRNLVEEFKRNSYENNDLLRRANENSYIKYDSGATQSIQNFSEKGTFIVASVGLNVVHGGAYSAAMGALYGMGKSAEAHYQLEDRGNFWEIKNAGAIIVDSGLTALEAYGYGQIGITAINAANAINEIGLNGAKELAREKLSGFSLRVATQTVKDEGTTILRNAAINTFKDKSFYLDTGATILGDIKTGLVTGNWDITHMIMATGASYGANFLGNLEGGLINVVNDSKNYGHRIDQSRNAAFEHFDAVNTQGNEWDLTPEQLSAKHQQIDAAAERLLEADAMDDYSQFYEVLGTDRGNRPDPNTYLRPDYIEEQLSAARMQGVSRFTSQDALHYHESNNRIGYFGDNNEYQVGSTTYSSSEFVTSTNTANNIVASCETQEALEEMLNVKPYKGNVYRYDIVDANSANVRMPSGNEPGAYDSDWIPGGMTLNGTSEYVIDGISLDNIKVSKVFE